MGGQCHCPWGADCVAACLNCPARPVRKPAESAHAVLPIALAQVHQGSWTAVSSDPLRKQTAHFAIGKAMLNGRGGGARGGLGPQNLCTKNGPIRFSQLQISLFPTMVTLVWRGGRGSRGGGPCSLRENQAQAWPSEITVGLLANKTNAQMATTQ